MSLEEFLFEEKNSSSVVRRKGPFFCMKPKWILEVQLWRRGATRIRTSSTVHSESHVRTAKSMTISKFLLFMFANVLYVVHSHCVLSLFPYVDIFNRCSLYVNNLRCTVSIYLTYCIRRLDARPLSRDDILPSCERKRETAVESSGRAVLDPAAAFDSYCQKRDLNTEYSCK